MYKYSEKTGSFYPDAIIKSYITLPTDLIDVEEDMFLEAMNRNHTQLLKIVDGVFAITPISPSSDYVWDDATSAVLDSTLATSNSAAAQIAAFLSVREALQAAIDVKAESFGFSGGNSLMLYAGFDSPFKTLAVEFAVWESQTWTEAGIYRDEVISGTKPMLSPDAAVVLMPVFPGEK